MLQRDAPVISGINILFCIENIMLISGESVKKLLFKKGKPLLFVEKKKPCWGSCFLNSKMIQYSDQLIFDKKILRGIQNGAHIINGLPPKLQDREKVARDFWYHVAPPIP